MDPTEWKWKEPTLMYCLRSHSLEARPELSMFSKCLLKTLPGVGVGLRSRGGQGNKTNQEGGLAMEGSLV